MHAPLYPRPPGSVALRVVDQYGSSDTYAGLPINLVLNAAPGPTPVINNGAPNATAIAGGDASLDNDGSLCPSNDCTTLWSLRCGPSGRGDFTNRTGNAIIVTTGNGPSYDINMANASAPVTCECRSLSTPAAPVCRHVGAS